jgi:AraC family transcriptional regulator of adaptative response/methylated-DNA-[protein]-cysteine methyltransferase
MLIPNENEMYDAFIKKDSNYEGVFFVAVKTTGIFCRPTCTARTPKRENIEFFGSAQEAMYAGYRACERCKPMSEIKSVPAVIKELSNALEKSVNGKISYIELKELGIDPSTARRAFKKYYGMTFNAYQRARRMGQALKQIREGDSVTGSQIDAGFQSASGFWNAAKQLFGDAPSKIKNTVCLLAKWIDTPLGAMVAIAGEEGLYMFEFVDRRGIENEITRIRKKTGGYIVPGENEHLKKTEMEITEYFLNGKMNFTVPVMMSGSQFEISVWKELQNIPPGKTISYSELAARTGRPGAVRAAGNANGKNCLAVIIPCHRVIGADGTLHGYGGGIWRKKKLIEHERLSIEKLK